MNNKWKKFLSVVLLISLSFPFSAPVRALDGKDNIQVYIDDQKAEFDILPVIYNGVVMVPLMETFKKLGYDVEWNAEKKIATTLGNNGKVTVTVDSNIVDINYVPIELPENVRIMNGVVMIPLCLIDDALKTETQYDADSGKVYIKMPAPYTPPQPKQEDDLLSKLPEGIPMLPDDALFKMVPQEATKEYIAYKEVEVEGMPFTRALEIETKKMPNKLMPDNIYDIQMVYREGIIYDYLPKEIGIMTFYVRAIHITDESGKAFVGACVERNYGGYQKAGTLPVTEVDREWKRVYAPLFNNTYDVRVGASQVTIRVGFQPQIIQVADLKVLNFKNTVRLEDLPIASADYTYEGMEDDALWRREAFRRIEKYRKNDMKIKVRDSEGNPVPNVKINMNMTRSEFLFGTCVRESRLFVDESSPDYIYQKLVLENFNAIVPESATKWTITQDDDGFQSIKVANWAYENHMYFRGHCLYWDDRSRKDFLPKALQNFETMTTDEVWEAMREHATKTVLAYKGKVVQWDVVNEPYLKHMVEDVHGLEPQVKLFNLVKRLDPDAKLYINEGNIYTTLLQIQSGGVRNMLLKYINQGAAVDGIAAESHFTNTDYPQNYYLVLDDLAQYVDEIAITEYDLDIPDDEVAAKYLRDMLIMIYSHPKATAFLMWGFTDAAHWRDNAPLFYSDYTPKPAYAYWNQYVLDEWKTRAEGVTDNKGELTLRGHRGDYEIIVEHNGRVARGTFKLVKNMDDNVDENVIEISIGKDIQISVSNEASPKISPIRGTTHTEAAAWAVSSREAVVDLNIVSSVSSGGFSVSHTYDNNTKTFWFSETKEDWVLYELNDKAKRLLLEIQWHNPNSELYEFKIEVSGNGTDWKEAVRESTRDKKSQYILNDVKYFRVSNEGGSSIAISEVCIDG